ncbi:winged helix DNA-binding domain-containing protein [Arthrobacter sp. zg-Y820]|uniref:winged helix DNA-binding domain-containing protein n=1 Tax=unclassified Arthrobacter TaxID=235627 RepID=UPI00253F8470|nr:MULTISPECIES: winged helix DNA-binding domain-containing protein [unclassified Arthrobacter]MCC9197418.1 winged helix DNA-binding domain-containing protein [Arthrobacter sp. zg-Y820]MDK1280285.1 winged helix DNA-binding domain-containing protein [Arthrobacter sp. zg.Y820]WIB09572.1 winged helix DNA-binding domain-containing protein [Arthrobacter sp. zg-Y820]
MAIELSGRDARRMRRQSQLLGGSDLAPADVVRRAVALQGQDLPAVLQAIAIRSRPGTGVQEVRDAFDRGDLVRGWPMRGTLFATTPEHLAALLAFTAERIRTMAARRRAELGLDEAVLDSGRETLRTALQEQPLLRSEALALWEAAGIKTAEGRGYHLLMHLSVQGLVHWGAFDPSGSQQYLALSAARPPDDPEAALAELVRGFVLARGPVTEADLAWWMKLPKRTMRRAAAAAPDLVEVRVEGRPAWIVGEPQVPGKSGVTLVPGFDEWILGYADRSLVASPEMLAALVPGNGMFRPAVLVDGVAVGTWRWPRTSRPSRAAAEPVLDIVERVPAATRRQIERALAAWPHR